MVVPFDDFKSISNNYSIKAYIYSYFDSVIEETIELKPFPKTPAGPPDLRTPLNLKRLELHKTKNVQYATEDLVDTEAMLIDTSTQLIVFKDEQAFTCVDGLFLNQTDFTCDDCPRISATEEYSMFFGVSDIKGYCNRRCSSGEICISGKISLQNLVNTYACQDPTDTVAYYTCEAADPTTKFNFSLKNLLYYNSIHSPANIRFTQGDMMGQKSYMIEIWYFPDRRFTYLSTVPTLLGLHNYVFYSNAIRIYLDTNDGLDTYYAYSLHNPNNPVDISANINLTEWNHIVAQVQYNDPLYTMRLYFNNDISTMVNLGTTNDNMSFTGFYMCNLESSSCDTSYGNFYWASGYYKDLRFWDGDIASPATIFTYNEL